MLILECEIVPCSCIYCIAYCKVGWLYWMIGFIVMSFFAGFVLSIVFQLAHTVEHTEFPIADIDTNKLPDELLHTRLKPPPISLPEINWLAG